MGWILVMFDLPVLTDTERKMASRFRKDLLDGGYLMIQFSIYARPCVSYEQMDTHIARVKAIMPEAGNVRLMFITDEQWGKSDGGGAELPAGQSRRRSGDAGAGGILGVKGARAFPLGRLGALSLSKRQPASPP